MFRGLALALAIVGLTVGCAPQNPAVTAPFNLDRASDSEVAEVAETWVNSTGLPSLAAEVWRPRLEEACNEGVWETDRAITLAQQFIEADLTTLSPPTDQPVNLAEAADALWVMGLQACDHLYPGGYEEDGAPFSDLEDVRGDASWDTQAAPQVLDPHGLVASARWQEGTLLWPSDCAECVAVLAASGPDRLVIRTRNTTCEPVATLQLTQSEEMTLASLALYDHLPNTYFGGDEYDVEQCGSLDKAWDLVIELNAPTGPIGLHAFDLRRWR